MESTESRQRLIHLAGVIPALRFQPITNTRVGERLGRVDADSRQIGTDVSQAGREWVVAADISGLD